MNITYHEENGYLLPNIVVGCDTSRPIGKYGRMRRKYLQEHRSILFSVMVLHFWLLVSYKRRNHQRQHSQSGRN